MSKLSDEYEIRVSQIVEKLTTDTQLRQNHEINSLEKNLWLGASGHEHQIDVSIHNDEKCLLVECKRWSNSDIKVEHVLTLLGRVIDIQNNTDYPMTFKGIIVFPNKIQKGARKIVEHYNVLLSYARISTDKEILKIVDTHFIKASFIDSNAVVYKPTIINESDNINKISYSENLFTVTWKNDDE